MFSVKEAVAKALGRGFDYLSWKDIEITHDEYGRPPAFCFLYPFRSARKKSDSTA